MGSAASAEAGHANLRADGILATHRLLAWIADVSIGQTVDGVPQTMVMSGACPARLEVLDGACVFDMACPGGLAIKLYLDADTCKTLLQFAGKHASGTSLAFSAAMLHNTRDPAVTVYLPFVTHTVLSLEGGGTLRQVVSTAKGRVAKVPGGIQWTFTIPHMLTSFTLRFTLADSERKLIRELFKRDKDAANMPAEWFGHRHWTIAKARELRAVLRGTWGHWGQQASFLKAMLLPVNAHGALYGYGATDAAKNFIAGHASEVVGTRNKVEIEAALAGADASAGASAGGGAGAAAGSA
jgi:hypothetical protein